MEESGDERVVGLEAEDIRVRSIKRERVPSSDECNCLSSNTWLTVTCSVQQSGSVPVGTAETTCSQ